MTGLRKSYSGVPVLKGVDLSVEGGEIHALLGANGAGKSTLIKCISGGEQPDAGRIHLGGEVFTGLTPKRAQREGVAVIHQTPSVALTLDAASNIHLGRERTWGPVLRRGHMRRAAQRVLDTLGARIDARADLRTLGNAQLQVIEIAKALASDPRVLILDEPTAALTEIEVRELAQQMRVLREQGLPLLLVTHRLTEALELADRISVLRGGEVVLSARTDDVTREDVVAAIVGRSLTVSQRPLRAASADESVVRLREIEAAGVGPISLDVGAGEVVGLYGLTGAGRTELLETLAGARRLTGGALEVFGQEVRARTPRRALSARVALVPSDRMRKSIFPTLSAQQNVLVERYDALALGGTLRRPARERTAFDRSADLLGLRPHRGDLEARRFSGGNQQKLVIARWLQPDAGVRLLLLDEPTDGVDVGARGELYDAIDRFVADRRRCVLIASSEPEELLRVADRVIVLSRGRVAGELRRDDLTEARLLSLAHASE